MYSPLHSDFTSYGGKNKSKSFFVGWEALSVFDICVYELLICICL